MKMQFSLLPKLCFTIGLILLTFSSFGQTRQQILNLKTEQARIKAAQQQAEAYEKAARLGWKTEGKEADGTYWQLMRLDEKGDPVYYQTLNLNARKTIKVDRVLPAGGAGLNLNGEFVDIGIWDGGGVRTTHQEFSSRVIQYDTPNSCQTTDAVSDHATHVCATMVGSSGMAFFAHGRAYDWCNDFGEMRSDANLTNYPTRLSNHSYGPINGWEVKDGIWTWFGGDDCGNNGDEICGDDEAFGQYDNWAANLDDIAYDFPNYLIFHAAGNDRGQTPSFGDPWQVDGNTDPFQVYFYVGPEFDPAPDGGNAGFDCLGSSATAKNTMTVGAVEDMLNYTGPSSVVMSSFSSWGPTDDGRIKPDIVANGVGVTSASSSADDAYVSKNGTSMATPSVTGACGLLQQHYWLLHNQTYMTAAKLKGLVIHTAEEAGTTGPDYKFGWGLMNTERAANLITEDNQVDGFLLQDKTLNNNANQEIEIFSTGEEPLRITIVWTDPAGIADGTSYNNTTPRLVNDLDLRLTTPSGNTKFPYVKAFGSDSQNNQAASTGDNIRDNVEQIYIANPEAGIYTVRISHKGTLVNNNAGTPNQAYALIMSDVIEVDENFTRNDFCSEAEFINCITPRTGNTQLSTASFPVGHSECIYPQEKGVWFTFNGSGQPMTVTTDFPETLFDTQIMVYEAGPIDPCISMTCIDANDDINGAANRKSRLTVNTILGKKYIVYLDGYNGAAGEFKISIEECPVPANDLCANATYLDCNSSVTGSSDFATSFEYSDQGCSYDNNYEGVWFKFFGTGEAMKITTNNPGTDSDYKITLCVFSGSCGNFSYVATGDFLNPRPFINLQSVAGTEYFVFMAGYCQGDCSPGGTPTYYPTGNYEIALSCPVTNDLCGDARLVTCNETVNGSTSGASNSDAASLVSCSPDVSFANGKGVWFKFIGTGDRLYVSTNNSVGSISSFNPELAIFTGECGELTCINASDHTGSNLNPFLSQITVAGTTYYIYLDGEDDQSGSYEIAFTCETPNADCATANTLTCGTTLQGNSNYTSTNVSGLPQCDLGNYQPGVWFSIQGTGDYFTISTEDDYTEFDTRLHVFSGSCGGWTCVTSNDDIDVNQNNLKSKVSFISDPNLVYYVYLDGYDAARGNYNISLSCAPENDLCLDAIPITCGQTLLGSTTHATVTGLSSLVNCAPNETEIGAGVWFSYIGTGDPVIFSTENDGTDFDTELLLYETNTDCSTLICVDGNDDVDVYTTNYNSSISLVSEIGKIYYLYLDGHSSGRGNYELNVTCNGTVDLEVVYRVDMNNEIISPNGIHIAGDFQSEAGFPEDWNPATTQVYSNNQDGIYERRILIRGVVPGATFMHKFINGNDWITSEGVPESCGMIDGCCFNRFIIAPTVGAASTSTDTPCYGNCVACAALPLELLSFTGEAVDKANVLYWEIANERDITWYSIERSDNALDFDFLAKIPVETQPNVVQTYAWTDMQPLPAGWYRLRSVETSGESQLSEVIYIERKVEKERTILQLYPNPTNGLLFIEFNSPKAEDLQMELFDMQGKRVQLIHVQASSGLNKQELSLHDLPSGMYLINVVFEDGKVITDKLILEK